MNTASMKLLHLIVLMGCCGQALSQCEAGVDLYFVIDSTGTLGLDGHAAMRRWAANLVDGFAIGTSNSTDLTGLARVGVIQFWGRSPFISDPDSQAMVDIELGNYADKDDLKQQIGNLEYKNGANTIIPHGLAKLNEEIDNHYDSRRSIYALVLTDGFDDSTPSNRANLRVGTLEEEANKIKAKENVEVFAIGFGARTNLNNLATIASQEGTVIIADDVGAALNRTYNRLITSLCPNIPTRPTPGTAQFQSCHDATGCGGNEVNVSSARECCLGSGFSFQDQSSRCRQCIVHGFVQTTDLMINEGATQEVIRMMMDVKGNTLRETTQVTTFDFSFMCIDSSNGGGLQAVDRSDFTATGCGTNIQLRLSSSSEVSISAVADAKIEGTEILMLQLVLTNATQTAVNVAGNIFIQDTLNIRVIDVTDVLIGFSEDDYTGDEGEPGDISRPNTPCTVTVEIIERTLEIPLQIKLTPREQSATRMDFNDTVILTEVPAAQTQLMQAIQIFDDEINEGLEVFNVSMEVVSNISNAVIYRIQTTRCRIRQSDLIEIGFTQRRIFHTEEFRQFETLINNSRAYEQTFIVRVELSTLNSPFGQSATRGEDFEITGNVLPIMLRIDPSEPNLFFHYQIFGDNTPENQEVFQLTITPAIGSPTFTCTEANGCFQQLEVVIVDDDVVVVGFVDTLVEVNEADGQATLNVSIISPLPIPGIVELQIMFSLRVDSMDDSAASHSAIDTSRNPIPGVEDFPQIVDSTYYTFQEIPFQFLVLNHMFNETQLSQTFTFPIFMDDVPEGVEELQLALSVRPDPQLPEGSVNVTPAVATVRIHDFSSVVVGFERHTYTVGEDGKQVELCVNITVPRRQDIGTVTFNLTVETHNGSAVSNNDYTSVSMTVGTFTSQRPRQCFNISITNDAIIEQTKVFTTRLTLIPDSVTTISTSQIIVDPPETTVQITDNDLMTVVGYNRTYVNAFEADRQAELIVSIIKPAQVDLFENSFYLLVNTQDGTATGLAPSDYGNLTDFRLGPFNNDVRQLSFNVSIANDNITEDAETFSVSLTLDSAVRAELVGNVTVLPAVATATIVDNDVVVVGYIQTTVTVLESEGVAKLQLTVAILAAQLDASFSLLVNTSDGTATAPGDYGSLTNFCVGPFNNSVRQLSFNVSIMDDNSTEDAEMFSASLTLDPADQARLGNRTRVTVSPDIATVTIQDDEAITVGYVQTAVNVSENDGVATLTVGISVPLGADPIETLFFLLVNTLDETATATAPSDFGNLTNFRLGPFNNDMRQLSFNMSIVDDSIPEDEETFNVSLTLDPADQARLGNRVTVSPDVATVTIQDNDDIIVGYSVANMTALESDGMATLTVVVTTPIETSFFLLVNTLDGAATAPSDYGNLTNFPLGPFNNDVHKLSFNVPVMNDNIPEDAEMFNVSLTFDIADQGNRIIVSPNIATVTIKDNDVITVGYTVTDVTASESDGVATLTVVVTLPPEDVPIETFFTLSVNTLDGTATAPSDYGNLTNFPLGPFNNSVRRLSFTVSIVNDSIPEDAETFNVSLTLDPADRARLGNRATVSPDVATLTIQDNDEITVGYNVTDITVSESDGKAQLTVVVTMPTGADPIETFFSLIVNTLNGTATAPSDYGALNNFCLGPFNNDVRQLSFNVSIVNDSIPEDDEMFTASLTLDPADQARLGNRVVVSPDVATITIQDDDAITVGYVKTAVNVSESDGVATLTVGISMPSEDVPIATSFSLLVNTTGVPFYMRRNTTANNRAAGVPFYMRRNTTADNRAASLT